MVGWSDSILTRLQKLHSTWLPSIFPTPPSAHRLPPSGTATPSARFGFRKLSFCLSSPKRKSYFLLLCTLLFSFRWLPLAATASSFSSLVNSFRVQLLCEIYAFVPYRYLGTFRTSTCDLVLGNGKWPCAWIPVCVCECAPPGGVYGIRSASIDEGTRARICNSISVYVWLLVLLLPGYCSFRHLPLLRLCLRSSFSWNRRACCQKASGEKIQKYFAIASMQIRWQKLNCGKGSKMSCFLKWYAHFFTTQCEFYLGKIYFRWVCVLAV